MARVGLVGLGLMGRGIGVSVLRAGHGLGVVAHRRREVATELIALGAWEAPDPAALAARCDAIVCCLPSIDAATQVLTGPRGVAAAGAKGLLVIESSTLTPAAAVELEARLAADGIDFVDAPVTRGPNEALAGRLAALVGGRPGAVDRAEPILRAYCEKVFRFGTAGCGYSAKLINNFLAFTSLAAVAEAMATARGAGLDLPLLLQAIATSGGQSRVLDGLAPVIAGTGASRSRVTIETAHKDVDYYARFARAAGTAGPMAERVVERLRVALDAGWGERFTPEYLDFVAGAPAAKAKNVSTDPGAPD